MAVYHLSSKIISRSKGQSSIASASYRSGSKMVDNRIGKSFDYTKKSEVDHSIILLPDNSPKRFYERETLWNEVEAIEKRKDSQLSREIELSLPIELTKNEKIELAKKFVNENFISQRMTADLNFHKLDSNNPHVHIMLSLRKMTPEGFDKKKNRDWNKKELLESWRKNWAIIANEYLKKYNKSIDHRSLKNQGINRKPQHENRVIYFKNKSKINNKKDFLDLMKNNINSIKVGINNLNNNISFTKKINPLDLNNNIITSDLPPKVTSHNQSINIPSFK